MVMMLAGGAASVAADPPSGGEGPIGDGIRSPFIGSSGSAGISGCFTSPHECVTAESGSSRSTADASRDDPPASSLAAVGPASSGPVLAVPTHSPLLCPTAGGGSKSKSKVAITASLVLTPSGISTSHAATAVAALGKGDGGELQGTTGITKPSLQAPVVQATAAIPPEVGKFLLASNRPPLVMPDSVVCSSVSFLGGVGSAAEPREAAAGNGAPLMATTLHGGTLSALPKAD